MLTHIYIHNKIMATAIGKYTYGAPTTVSYGHEAKLYIGSFCSIASNLSVYLGGNHPMEIITTYPFGIIYKHAFPNVPPVVAATKGDVRIGNDVWIGSNVTIMAGVTIGDGAVLACNSHVVRNVQPYSVVGGNPAQFIKFRFTEEQREKLLRIKWWEWEDDKINQNLPLLLDMDINKFIDKHTQ
jgi:acetyltransferase-like isoleucine patch superfamily enzyme